MIRGIRGAVTCEENSAEAILAATRSLLYAIMDLNPGMNTDDLASVFFTVTPDLNADFPALAARQIGWIEVPLMCAREIDVPNGMKKCIRVLAHWNTDLSQKEINHAYLGEAAALRPDIHMTPAAKI